MGLRGVSALTVLLLGSASSAGGGLPRFAPAELLASQADAPVSNVAAADLNCDGLQDLLVTRLLFRTDTTEPVSVFVNDGHGGFRDETASLFVGAVPRTTHGRQIVIADFNGDHCDDAYIPDTGNDAPPHPGYPNTLILSAPGGKLVDASRNIPYQSAFTHSGAAADVNGDGAVDIFEGNLCCENATTRVLLNDGTGTFSVATDVLPANIFGLDAVENAGADEFRPYSSRFVDVNNDGRPDLVLGGGNNTTGTLLLVNTGGGHLRAAPEAIPAKPLGVDALVNGIGSGDLNGDGFQDLVLAYTRGTPYYEGSYLQILINDGSGRFRDETAAWFPQDPNNKDVWVAFVEITDLNGDGRPDIVPHFFGGNFYGATATVLLNEGGHFTAVPGSTLGTFEGLYEFVHERDGRLDLFTINPSFNGIPEGDYVRRELRAPPAPAGGAASHGTSSTGVVLSWRPADQAAHYEIWRTSKASRARVGVTVATRFVDRTARSGRRYAYAVRGVNAEGAGPFASLGVGYRHR
jgi:FG-GAP-like repeat